MSNFRRLIVLGGLVLLGGLGASLAASAQTGGGEPRITLRLDGARSVYVQDTDGVFYSYVLGAPDFVNAGFAERWIAGPLPVVTRVIDGDTIEVRTPDGEIEGVRLLLVDTPEVHGGAECFGREASDFVAALLSEGDAVRLERDVTNRDAFGRLLRYVWLPGGAMLNERLAAGGFAQYLAYDSRNVKYAERIEAAAERARAAGAGLWSACPPDATPTPTPTPTPAPTPTPTPTPAAAPPGEDCDPGYIGLCVPPPPPDLNCPDIRAMLREQGLDVLQVRADGEDSHGLDLDRDGLACETEG